MPLKKNPVISNIDQSKEKTSSQNPNSVIFISHDSRDADLAEEFSNLLKSASAGALKSFRSSDKKGTQGIAYGQEWYPAIMEKIDEASDVVCLLTQHSVDRPWILYEAGVAKGKLDKTVIGIAMGIPLSKAISGPFAQFQNNDGDVESITKLVLELVRKVPGLDPDQNLVKTLAESFVKKSNEIYKLVEQATTTTTTTIDDPENVDQNSVAKLFEEVKIMFDSLPSKIESRIEPNLKRKKRFHPMMLEEIMHFEMISDDPYVGFLIIISMYKDEFPWFYEIGMETYRGLKIIKNSGDREKLTQNFEKALGMLRHPFLREMYGNSKDTFMLIQDSKHIFHRLLERMYIDRQISKGLL